MPGTTNIFIAIVKNIRGLVLFLGFLDLYDAYSLKVGSEIKLKNTTYSYKYFKVENQCYFRYII